MDLEELCRGRRVLEIGGVHSRTRSCVSWHVLDPESTDKEHFRSIRSCLMEDYDLVLVGRLEDVIDCGAFLRDLSRLHMREVVLTFSRVEGRYYRFTADSLSRLVRDSTPWIVEVASAILDDRTSYVRCRRPLRDDGVTIVTAYYQLSGKRPHSVYLEWIRNMASIPCHWHVFVGDEETRTLILDLRRWAESRTYVELLPFDQLEMSRVDWSEQRKLDSEAHSSDLYIVWNQKAHFVRRAIERNHFASSYFFWVDIGCVRDEAHRRLDFPLYERVKAWPRDRITYLLFPGQPDDGVLAPCGLPTLYAGKSRVIVRIVGGEFGGHIDAWSRYLPAYYSLLDKFLEEGWFAGKDQHVMHSLALLRPELIHGVKVDDWFALLTLLS